MKKYKRITSLILFFFMGLFFISQNVLSQGLWGGRLRETLKEKIKERRQERFDNKPQSIVTPGDYDFSLVHDGRKRTYKVHVPPSYNNTMPTALLFAFHGGGGNAEMMATDKYYNLISKSDQEGFIVVFPNGASRLRSGKFATWNAGNCCAYARDNHIDDVGFVKAMINDLKGRFTIDSQRIYATGFSNGAMLSYRLACELSDTFAAIATVGGTENCDNCTPSEPISIMHIHARDDGHSLFNGGAGNFNDISKVTDFTSVPETISRWVKRNNCNNTPKRVLEKQGVYCNLYTGCNGGVQVKLCVTETGGHSWPGGIKPRKKADTPSNAISAVDEVWDFCKSKLKINRPTTKQSTGPDSAASAAPSDR